jgi:hypothetical protein
VSLCSIWGSSILCSLYVLIMHVFVLFAVIRWVIFLEVVIKSNRGCCSPVFGYFLWCTSNEDVLHLSCSLYILKCPWFSCTVVHMVVVRIISSIACELCMGVVYLLDKPCLCCPNDAFGIYNIIWMYVVLGRAIWSAVLVR